MPDQEVRARAGRLRRRLGAASLALFTMATLWSYIQHAPLDHDEQMYVASGALARQHTLYRDFAYLQTPNYPLLMSAVFGLSGDGALLPVARTVSFVFVVLCAWLVYRVVVSSSGDRWVAGALTCGFLLNGAMEDTMPLAWNNVPALFLGVAAYACLRRADTARWPQRRFFVAGLLAGLAAGFKLFYVSLAPAVVVAAVASPGGPGVSGARRWSAARAACLGLSVGLGPIIYYLIRFPEQFLFDNVTFFNLSSSLYIEEYGGPAATRWAKLQYLWANLQHPVLILLACAGAAALWVPWKLQGADRSWRVWSRPASLYLVVGTIVSFALVLVPTPLHRHYLLAPTTFGILIVAVAYADLEGIGRAVVRPMLLVAASAALYWGGSAPLGALAREMRGEETTGQRIGRASRELWAALPAGSPVTRVATLSPLFVLGSSATIYPELATGPFLYRVADRFDVRQHGAVVATSPTTIGALFERSPPDALLTGLEGELDQPLIAYARSRDYDCVTRGGEPLTFCFKTDRNRP